MNCMADSKENYKFDLGVEGSIELNVLKKKENKVYCQYIDICDLPALKY